MRLGPKSLTGCRTLGGTRTPNLLILSQTPLPIRLRGHCAGPQRPETLLILTEARGLHLDQQVVTWDQFTVQRRRLHENLVLAVGLR